MYRLVLGWIEPMMNICWVVHLRGSALRVGSEGPLGIVEQGEGLDGGQGGPLDLAVVHRQRLALVIICASLANGYNELKLTIIAH